MAAVPTVILSGHFGASEEFIEATPGSDPTWQVLTAEAKAWGTSGDTLIFEVKSDDGFVVGKYEGDATYGNNREAAIEALHDAWLDLA